MSQQSRKSITAELIAEHAHFFSCPICTRSMLFENNTTLVCTEGHSYDLAKKGYIHLLSQSVDTKYDKALFQSRQRIAESGFFTPLIEAIADLVESARLSENIAIFDAGCGEGSHLAQIQKYVTGNTIGFGADISKEGIQLAASNPSKTIWLVADLAKTPLANQKFPFILNVLSPSNYSEFDRLLTDDGQLIKVIPNSAYLQELRKIFYGDKENFDNEKTMSRFQEKFDLIKNQEVKYQVRLEQPLLNDLVKMTPLSWSANEAKRKQVSDTSAMDITVDMTILVGKRRKR